MFDIPVNSPAFLHCGYNRGKVIVRQRHIRRAFCHIRSGNSHCTADIRRLQRRSIVHAVTGHSDNLTLILPCFHDTDFILRRHSGIYGYMAHLFGKLLFTHFSQLRTGNGLISFFQDPQIPGNRRSGNHMVPGNHHRLDTRLPADGNRVTYFRTGRINHAHQSHKGKAVFQLLYGRVFRHLINLLTADRQHTEGVGTHGVYQLLCFIHIS